MAYQVSRNGQLYGPYTLEELRHYLGTGNVLPTDMAKSPEMAEWQTVAAVLGTAVGGYDGPPRAVVVGGLEDAPNLSWVLVLLFDVVTFGLFQVVWNLVLSAWARRVEPESKALMYYAIATVLLLMNGASSFGVVFEAMRHQPMHPHYLGGLLSIAAWVVRLIARFTMRDTLELHYNRAEPMGLRLGGAMTFFFGGLYFQFKLNEVNAIKRAMRQGVAYS